MPRYTVCGSGPDCKSGVNDSLGSTPRRGTIYPAVAQLAEALVLGTSQCGFESHLQDH